MLCQAGTAPWRVMVRTPWQVPSRSASAAARKTLSRHVAESEIERPRPGMNERGPWGNINQREARITDKAPPRSEAEIKRSTRGREEPEDEEEEELFHALKMQRALAPMGYGVRSAIKHRIAEITRFEQFQLLPVVLQSIATQALPGLGDLKPTPVQRVAIPALLESAERRRQAAKTKVEDEDDFSADYEQFLIAAETGSGKTLAYLVPVIDAIKRAELIEKEEEEARKREEEARIQEAKAKKKPYEIEGPELSENLTTNAGRPRALILVPTSELVAQVTAKVKAFSHTVKFRSNGISSRDTPRKIRNIVFNPNGIDILVSTPHLLASIAKNDPFVLSRVTHIVVDEADSLMDRSFAPTTTEIIDKSAPSLQQLIFCSATIPRSFDSLLRKKYPDIRRLATPNLHAIPRRVQLGVVDIDKDPYRGNRSLACADVIWSLGKAGDGSGSGEFSSQKKIIVFVNEREEADEVTEFLRYKGIDAFTLSRDSADRNASNILDHFTGISTEEEIQRLKHDPSIPFDIPEEEHDKRSSTPRRRLPNTKVLVTTDLGSRGIDTLAVKYVILYDVPHTTIDFIHRLGRVGRMGRRGRGIVLVGKKDRKDIVREVRDAMYRGQALI